VKRRLIRELREAFRTHPVYEKITISNKYQLDEKSKFGIIIKNSSAEQTKLSADNYLGLVSSRAAIVNISGNAIEWVREDSRNLLNAEVEDVSEQADGSNRLFELSHGRLVGLQQFTREVMDIETTDVSAVSVYVDNLPVPVLEINPKDGLVLLSEAPADGALVKISYYWLNLAPSGVYGVEITSANQFMVDPLIQKGPFPLTLSSAKVSKIFLSDSIPLSSFDDIQVLVDGVPTSGSNFVIDDTTRTLTFTKTLDGDDIQLALVGSPTVLEAGTDYFLVKRQSSELLSRKTSGVEKILDLEFDTVVPGTLEIWFDDNKISNQADATTDPFSTDKITFTLVDGYKVTFSTSLPPSLRVTASYLYRDPVVRDTIPIDEVFDNSFRVMLPDANIIPKSVDVWVKNDLLPHEDFVFDTETNDLVFYAPLPEQADIKVSYYCALASEGPFDFEPYGANNKAIPGCILSFAKQAEVGGKQLIFVSDNPEPTAEEYGGKFRVTFSMDVVSLDPIQQEEITDLAAMYLLALKEKFDSEGLILEEVSIQGEAEEPYDENTTDQYYMASLGATFLTDWHLRKALPIKIRETYVRLVASIISEEFDSRVFLTPSLYPVLDNAILRAERIT